MPFVNRWLIAGKLIVRTPLHIGGDPVTRPDLIVPAGDAATEATPVQIAGVVTLPNGKPYLPATTLKGALRNWLEARLRHPAWLDRLFGSGPEIIDQPRPPDSLGARLHHWFCGELDNIPQGGKLEFQDAPLLSPYEPSLPPPYWCPERQTGVEVAVAINRLTRTAQDKKLIHREYVPPGAAFRVIVTGQDLGDDEVAVLLAGLEGFNGLQPIALGNGTASGKGRLRWRLDEIARLTRDDLADWLAEPGPSQWYEALRPLDRATVERLCNRAATAIRQQPVGVQLQVRLRLEFDGPFLVNEPPPEAVSKDHPEIPDHQPRRDAQGNVVLPAKSLRGAIRAQAERIIRTLNGQAACRVDDPDDACQPIERYEEKEQLCLACQLFGAPGWRTPLRISDFTLVEPPGRELVQDFVAIDRFTGGAAHQRKFRARVAYRPVLEGTLELDLRRMQPWQLGLLALVLRDLHEGDIHFGYGAAKGYGSCTGRVTAATLQRLPADLTVWWELLQSVGIDPHQEPNTWLQMLVAADASPATACNVLVGRLVDKLHRRLEEHSDE